MGALDLVQIRPGMTVARQHADRFTNFMNDLEAAGYKINPNASGGYNPRNIAGTNIPSHHASGSAIDVNWGANARGTQGDIPADLARSLAQKHGLTWGGDWKNPDPMHFEVAGLGRPAPASATMGLGGDTSQPQPQQQASPYSFGGQTQMDDQAPSGGFFDRLASNLQSPLFMMGAGAMSGKTLGEGLMQGAQAAQLGALFQLAQHKARREMQQQQQRDQMWQSLFQPGGQAGELFKGFPAATAQAAYALGPDKGSEMIAKMIASKGDQQFQLDTLGKTLKLKQDLELELQRRKAEELQRQAPEFFGGASQPAQSAGPQTRLQMFSGSAVPNVPTRQGGVNDMSPEKLVMLERSGLLEPGQAKVITESPGYQARQRERVVEQYGYDKKDPATQAYMMNGKMPELIPDRHAIMEADRQVREGRKVANSLDIASGYSDKAYSGYGAGARAAFMNNVPFLATESSKATADMDTEMITSMLPQLKAAFPQRITNQDIKLFESIQPSSGMTLDQRTQAIKRAKERIGEMMRDAQMEADQLRGGSFYRIGGGVSGGQKAPEASGLSGKSDAELLNMLGVK